MTDYRGRIMTPEEREVFLREFKERLDLLVKCDPDGVKEVARFAASKLSEDEQFRALVLRALCDDEEE